MHLEPLTGWNWPGHDARRVGIRRTTRSSAARSIRRSRGPTR